MNEKRLELVKGLGPWAAMAMVVGHIIGTGIFRVPRSMAEATGSVGLVFLVWIVGGFLSLAGALTVAELGASMPHAGGPYVYLKRGFGQVWGFLFGWMNNLVGKPASIATIAAGFLIFLGFFFPATRTHIFTLSMPVPFAEKPYEFVFTWAQPLAALAIAVVTFINYLGVRLAGRLQVVLTIIKISSILAVVALGFALGKPHEGVQTIFPETLQLTMLGGFLTAMVGALWAYDGWIDLTFAGSEVQDPQKNIPRAVVGGTIIVGAVYLLTNAICFYVLPLAAVAKAAIPVSEAVAVFAGAQAAAWITAAMVLSAFTTLNSSILTGARVPYAMAQDGLFFRVADGVHPLHRTPAGALVFQGVMAGLMVLSGEFEDLFSLFIFAQWIFYALTVASVFGLRKREPDLHRPYRAWGYPWLPALFVIGATALTVNLFIQRPMRSSIGLALILSGLVFYRHWQKSAASLSE
ncbi:MAG: amino acid permease [Acidobacteria bacterium]|nr:amino acid permease [Acidobacteriota bacterium]MBI3664553.1 amino acid permease [Acidobacteriota bacterium]